jgi:hypothetical protein
MSGTKARLILSHLALPTEATLCVSFLSTKLLSEPSLNIPYLVSSFKPGSILQQYQQPERLSRSLLKSLSPSRPSTDLIPFPSLRGVLIRAHPDGESRFELAFQACQSGFAQPTRLWSRTDSLGRRLRFSGRSGLRGAEGSPGRLRPRRVRSGELWPERRGWRTLLTGLLRFFGPCILVIVLDALLINLSRLYLFPMFFLSLGLGSSAFLSRFFHPFCTYL